MAASSIETLKSVEDFLQRQHASYIDGACQLNSASETLALRNPADDQVLASVQLADARQVDSIVESAHRASKSGVWSRLAPGERERTLLRFADLVEAHGEELAQLETLNQGKSIHLSRAI